jgi:hypothetical protein
MATMDDVDEALLAAVQAMAEEVTVNRSTPASQVIQLAAAAKDFAEARAWLRSVNQPH